MKQRPGYRCVPAHSLHARGQSPSRRGEGRPWHGMHPLCQSVELCQFVDLLPGICHRSGPCMCLQQVIEPRPCVNSHGLPSSTCEHVICCGHVHKQGSPVSQMNQARRLWTEFRNRGCWSMTTVLLALVSCQYGPSACFIPDSINGARPGVSPDGSLAIMYSPFFHWMSRPRALLGSHESSVNRTGQVLGTLYSMKVKRD